MSAARKTVPMMPIADVQIPDSRKRQLGDIKRLAESISTLGLLNPITVTTDGVLVAGLHRLEACRSIGWVDIPVSLVKLGELERELAEIDENLIRNELTVLERSEHLQRRMAIYLAMHPETERGKAGANAKHGRANEMISFAEETAGALGVSQRTIQQEVQIASKLTDDERDAVRETPLADSKTDLLDLAREKSPEKRAAIIGKVKSGGASSVKEARGALKLDAKRALAAELNATPLPATSGRFHVIVIDPPWQYEKRAEDHTHRGRNPYPDMGLDAIKALPVGDRAEENCVLWLWTTNAFMREAYECLDAWGFAPKTILTWVKDRMGTGDWLRGRTEHCLMAIRGKPVVTLTNQTTAMHAALREHSRKPDEFYALVESLCPGTRLEFFARERRDGWQAWGAETDKFKEE